MAKRFEVYTEAERFIHNDLSNCAFDFELRTRSKIDRNETDGIYHDMMASLIFSAFSIEAKVNFVGWKHLKGGWPESASLREKIELLSEVLDFEIDWGCRPWQTIMKVKRLRNTLAHGKPEVVSSTSVVDIEPEIWAALRSQWEESVTPDFVTIARQDENSMWRSLLEAAGISISETLTHGEHSLNTIVESDN